MLTKQEIKSIQNTPDDLLLDKFPEYTRKFLRSIKNGTYKKQKVYVIDIETAPITAYAWGIWEENIQLDRIVRDWFVICFSVKELGKKNIISHRLTAREVKRGDDKRIMKKMRDILDDADIVIAHNGDRFDIRKINARFMVHGIKYPSPYKSIDTLKVVKREFNLTSNKLDYICHLLGIKGKIDTGGQRLWNECLQGSEQALVKMSRYCDNDIKILEKVFIRLQPYMRTNPKSWDVKLNYTI